LPCATLPLGRQVTTIPKDKQQRLGAEERSFARQARMIWNSGNPQVDVFSKGWFDCEALYWSNRSWGDAGRVRDWVQQPIDSDEASHRWDNATGRYKDAGDTKDEDLAVATERASGAGVAWQRRLLMFYRPRTSVPAGEPSHLGRRSEDRNRENSSERIPPVRF
jgi:hypothetical protein